jgi:dTDP-4-amino-4,6-dideoxygalactose transaminase
MTSDTRAGTGQLTTGGPTADPDPVLFAVPEVTEDDIAAVTRVLRSGWLTTGTECAGLEADLAHHLGAAHVVAVSSCTAALEISLAHLRLPPGSRVGVPAWTFISTALAAVHNNLTPVLLDVDPTTLNLSPRALSAALDRGLDAVIAVHFGGVPVAAEVHHLCAAAGVPLVEDAAHALGSRDHRGPVGGPGGAAVCFSFYATKNLTSAEGGAIATDDADLAAFARAYRLHGMSADALARYQPGGSVGYDLVEPGIKANLPDVLAALARSQLRRFDHMQARRRELLATYRAHLEPRGLRFVPGVPDPGSADHLAVVVLPDGVDRAAVITGLKAAGIHPSVHFRPLHHFSWFAANAAVGPGGLPVCDALADRMLSLPLHVGLTETDIQRVADTLTRLTGP